MTVNYKIGWTLWRSFFEIFYSYEATGYTNLPEERNFIIASNHVSYFDPPIVGTAFKYDIFYFARKTLFKNNFISWLLRSVNTIPVDQEKPNASSIKESVSVIKNGKCLLVFPEGERSLDGKIKDGKPGIGLIIAKTMVPVVPVRVFGAHEALPRNAKLPRRSKIKLVIGKAIEHEEILQTLNSENDNSEPNSKKKNYSAISNLVMERIKNINEPN